MTDAAARNVLDFWFGELTEAQHWRKDADLDKQIDQRFGALRAEVIASNAQAWRDDPDELLAAIIVVDQFSRNIHRGSARAFEGDPLALELAKRALDQGWVDQAPRDRQSFYLMPLMHSETLADQDRCVAEFERLGLKDLDFALRHRDQIVRFGRFPGRNVALGRTSTADEQAVIDRGETF